MNSVVISIGSNCEDCNLHIANSIKFLDEHLNGCSFSEVYRTSALNGKDADYLNAVVSGYADCEFETLSKMLKSYESANGRTPECKLMGSVPIDLDIVIWNDEVLRPRDYKCDFFQIGWKQIVK